MPGMSDDEREPEATELVEFAAAAAWVTDLVAALPPDHWDRPGLGGWDLRALVGHTSRSLVTVLTYLRTETDRVDVRSALSYIVAIAQVDPASVVERGVQAGRDLGDDPAGRFAGLTLQALAALRADDLDRPIVTIAGGMRIRDYLPTRTFELVVHGLDIARAVALETDPPADPLRTTVELAVAAAVTGGHAAALLLALTGRETTLGFSIT